MATKNDEEPIAKIREKAALLLLLLQENRRSSKESWQLILWLVRSQRHISEFILIYRQDLELTRAMRIQRERSRVTYVNWWRGSPQRHANPWRRYRIGRAAAALFVAAAVLVVAPRASSPVRMSVESTGGMIATASQSEVRRLEDNSTVSVDPNSTLREEFTEKSRDVHLFQGKAMFDVAEDERNRPFVVKTPFADFTAALDSKFAVKVDITAEVEVYEGDVEISMPGAKPGAPTIRVKKGSSFRVPVGGLRGMMAMVAKP